MNSDESITAIVLFEALGKPPEHLKDVLEDIFKRIGEEKGVKVIEQSIKDAQELESHKGIYTTFGELTVELDEVLKLVYLVFKYMPAHIEIVSPEQLTLENNDMNEVFNEITRRLHAYDEVARVIQNEKKILENKVRELTGKNVGQEKDDDDSPAFAS